ncbi:MAG: diaminopimelate decarboxylase [Candidatus Geothermincolia bacterium]
MNYFDYSGDRLYCEQVALADIAAEVGTPTYVYSLRTLREHYRALEAAFSDIPHLICYSVKACSNLAVLRELRAAGAGADIVSGGELYRAMNAGIAPETIVYAGIGKTADEIAEALRAGVLMFNVESAEELEQIDAVAGGLGVRAAVALRINPDVDPLTHPYIATGLRQAKFGIPIADALAEYRKARELRNLDPVGVHSHIGSQITEVEPYLAALDKLGALVKTLRDDGFDIDYVNMGGGFGIPYRGEEVPLPADYASVVGPALKRLNCRVIWEIGRMIVGNAGVLVMKVLYRKRTPDKDFLIVDAAMNDLIRPSLYGSYHEILPLESREREMVTADVVGPICESGDFLAKERQVPLLERGEMAAVMSAGAYGFTMSSNYNSRRRAAEVVVDGDTWRVARERESYEDLVRRETAE